MPAAAVTATAGLGAAALQARGVNRATDAQARATREAMQYQRESEWRQRSNHQRQYDAYMRAVYGDRYQPARPAAQMGAPAAAAVPGAAPMAPGASAVPGAAVPPLVPSAPVRASSLADLAGWGNWNGRRNLSVGV